MGRLTLGVILFSVRKLAANMWKALFDVESAQNHGITQRAKYRNRLWLPGLGIRLMRALRETLSAVLKEKTMHDDDRKAGFDLSRRAVLALLGAARAAMLDGRANARADSARSTDGKLPACIVTPEQTEGPVDERLNRSGRSAS